jgi:hypothetical protein
MAKFVWKVEEMKFMNMNKYEREDVAEQYSFTEKQAIIQEQGFFNFDDFWNKYTKFQAEKDTIKSRGTRWDGKPDYYYNSLKAWCKRNGIETPSYRESYEWLELTVFYTGAWTRTCTLRLDNDMNDIVKVVNASFIEMFSKLAEKEKAWFLAHDEYSIQEKEAQNNLWNHLSVPSLGLSYGTQGIFIKKDDDTDRKVTLEELKQINDYYRRVQDAINSVERPKFTF